MVWSFSHVSILNHDATTWLDQYISICFNPSKSRFIKPSRIAGLLQVLRSFQKQSTQDCVVLALKSKVEHDIEEEFQVVRITDFENINLWMREDNPQGAGRVNDLAKNSHSVRRIFSEAE